MKLFLTSSASQVINFITPLLPKPATELKCAFIPTAADVYTSKPWLWADRNSLVKFGFSVFDVNLTGHSASQLKSALQGVDVVFVSGGNTFYLLDQVQRTGFAPVITELVNQGVIYIGSSAGSVLAGPDISFVGWHPDWDANDVGLTDPRGLSLVPFVVSPHYTEADRELLESKLPSVNYQIFPLTDSQGFLVQDSHVELVGTGPGIVLHPEHTFSIPSRLN